MKIAIFALLALLVSASVFSEERSIYLIASEPYDDSSFGFPTLLYRVEESRLVKVRTVTTQRQSTMFVDVFPGRGYALVGSDLRPLSSVLLDVIDMNAVSNQKSFEIEICNGCSGLGGRLLDRQGGPAYFLNGYNDGRVYKGVSLQTGRILSDFDRTEEANAYRTGSGSPFADGSRSFGAVVHQGDWLIYGEGDSPRRQRLVGWEEPKGYGWAPGSTITYLIVNNDDIRLISVVRHSKWEGEVRGLGLHVQNKASREWSRLDLPGAIRSFRAFGHWLVSQEIFQYEPGSLDLERLDLQCFPPFLPAAVNLSMVREMAPSGRLFFYNEWTKEWIVHDTGDPNSEPLFVDEAGVAWYRVSDELRRAPIRDGKLEPVEVVAKAPEIWAVHWLFFGRD